jgi:hypothetical protein
MSLDRAAEIMSWPLAQCDPARLAVKMQVWRVVFTICVKAYLSGKLGREAARERDREHILTELARREFGAGDER